MDFCGDLTNIQSIFNYANEYIKPLNKIRFRGGKFIFYRTLCIFIQYFNHSTRQCTLHRGYKCENDDAVQA